VRALFSCRSGQQKTDATFFEKDERISHAENISVLTMAFSSLSKTASFSRSSTLKWVRFVARFAKRYRISLQMMGVRAHGL